MRAGESKQTQVTHVDWSKPEQSQPQASVATDCNFLQLVAQATGCNKLQLDDATAVFSLYQLQLQLPKILKNLGPVPVQLRPKKAKRPDWTGLLNTSTDEYLSDRSSYF